MLARHLSRTSRRGTELVFRIHSFRMKERPSLFQAHLRWCNDSFPFHIKGFWNYENCFHHIGNHLSTQNHLKFFLHEMDVYNKHSHGIFHATWGKQPLSFTPQSFPFGALFPTPTQVGSHCRRCARIKLIDFGSACTETSMLHTYIQSRFYRRQNGKHVVGESWKGMGGFGVRSFGCMNGNT